MDIGTIGHFRPSLNVITLHVKHYLGTLGRLDGWLIQYDNQSLDYLGASL